MGGDPGGSLGPPLGPPLQPPLLQLGAQHRVLALQLLHLGGGKGGVVSGRGLTGAVASMGVATQQGAGPEASPPPMGMLQPIGDGREGRGLGRGRGHVGQGAWLPIHPPGGRGCGQGRGRGFRVGGRCPPCANQWGGSLGVEPERWAWLCAKWAWSAGLWAWPGAQWAWPGAKWAGPAAGDPSPGAGQGGVRAQGAGLRGEGRGLGTKGACPGAGLRAGAGPACWRRRSLSICSRSASLKASCRRWLLWRSSRT